MTQSAELSPVHPRHGAPLAATLAEGFLVAALCALYLFSFGAQSPLFGPTEVFYQDTVYILEDLTAARPYSWNPQHHLLYHLLVEDGYALLRRLSPGGLSPFAFLRLFTALTGLAFLIALGRLFRELDLPPPPRLILLVLAGVSFAAWFNFTAFETHALPIAALVEALVRLRRVARHTARPADRLALVLCLAFVVLCRWENWRLLPALAVVAALPALSGRRRALLADLGAVVLVAGVSYFALTGAYFRASWAEVPSILLSREEGTRLDGKLMRLENLRPGALSRMVRTASLHTLAAPISDAGLRDYLRATRASPLALVSLSLLAVLFARLAYDGARGLARGDPFVVALAVLWASGVIFNTYLNPFEPFPWVLNYLPLVLAALALSTASAGRRWRLFLAFSTLTVLAHNVVHFWGRYR